jgi:hypothetical protein
MYILAQKEGYKKTPEEFKTLLGVKGEPVTEGSVEQQEQPTEPLKKPYSDFSWDDGTSKPALKVTSAKEELDSKLESSNPAEIKTPFQEALNKRINEMGGPVDIPEEEQLEYLDIIKKKNKELALSTDPQQKINKDVSGKKIEAQERLDELLLKEFPIEVINPGGRNVSPTIENAEKLTQLDPAFSDFMYSKALKQPNFYDKLKKGQVTDTEKYDILSEYNNIKTQNSYNNLQATINENNKLVKEIDDSIEKQKESMLSTPYFISDLDGKFSIGEINSPEEREEAQAMYDELSSLYEDKKKQSTSPRFSSEYIDFLNASAKQDALETGEYENIHKKIKENQLYAKELMDGSYESFAKDFGARGVNTVSGFIANTMAFPASVASSYRSITGADYKYGVSDMVVDWAERAGSPMVTSERSFAMKDPLTGETRYDAGDFALSVTDQLGLFLGLAVGNKVAASRQLYKLSKIGVTGKRAAEAMKISQRYNTLITGTMASHTHTYREAREMGLRGEDLFVYTTFMSTLEGFSELVFPNQGIFGKDLKDIGLKAFIKNLSKGRSVALKDSFRQIIEAMGSEAAEEYLVLLGKMAETSLISLNNDNIETYIPEFEEIISTGAIAAAMAGGSTAGIQTYQNITGAKRKEVMSYAISKGTEVDFNGLTEAVGQQVKQGNVSAAEATMYLAQVHEANDFVKYIPDEIKGRTRQELLPIAKEIDSLTKQSKEKEGAAKKAIQERIRVLEGYMESKIQSYPADRGPRKEQAEATEKTTEQPTYDKPTVFTTPTSERYGTVNRQDGKGGVVLTEEEYNNEVSLFEQQPTETTTEESKDEVSGYVDKLVEDLETETFGNKKVVDDILSKMNDAEYINDEDIDGGISAIFDEIDRVNNLNISEGAKKRITEELFNVAEELDNYEFRTKTTTKTTTAETTDTGGKESTKKVPKKKTKAEVDGVSSEVTLNGDGTVSITSTSQTGVTTGTTQEFTFPEEFLFVDENGDFSAVQLETADGKKVVITNPNIGIDLALSNMGPATVEEVNEEIRYVKESAPVVEETVVTEETFEQKESEIESRRQAELEANSKFTGEKVVADQINAKYDSELNRLKAQENQKEESKKKPTKKVVKEEVTEKVEPTKPITEETLTEEETSALDDILGFSGQKKSIYTENKSEADTRRLKRVDAALNKIQDAFQKIFPNLYIGIAEDSDMFAKFAKEQNTSKESRSRGVFTPINVEGEPKRYGIILNPDFANVTTAFHEAFHALMKVNGFNNEQARAVTSRMIKSVQKGATPELNENLEAFVSQYKTPEQSEEYMAELFGILSYNYSKQSGTVKGIIKRWLRKLAEILGLKPKNTLLSSVGLSDSDAATVKMLNVLADKMSRGKVLSKEDVTALRMGGPLTAQQVAADMRMDGWQVVGDENLPEGVKFQVDAWHGSPYMFYKFTTGAIGTGEGVQAFGWGLYFTDLESIAKNYADKLTPTKVIIDGRTVDRNKNFFLYKAAYDIANLGYERAVERNKELISDGNSDAKDILGTIEGLKEKDVKFGKDANVYKVSLHKGKSPSEYTWLEWYKKPSKEQVSKLFSKLNQEQLDKGFYYGISPSETNGSFYKKLSKALGGDKAASLFLLENGIDGIKYPAESISRGATSDTARGFNYVVFDENAVSIEEVVKLKKSKRQPEENKKLKDAIEFAKDNNLSPKKLNNYLLSKGYTQEEIDEATPVESKPKESIKKLINKVSRLTDNNEARAIVAKELRELLKDSKLSQFSKRTINKVITSLKNTNVSNMQKMLDKVDDAISNDEGRAERIKRYKNRSIAIKRIAKIGPLKELQDPFIRMMGIDPKYLSKEAQKEYDSVLSDILNINKKYDKTSRDTFKAKIDLVLDSYDIDSVRAKEIADRINELIDPTKTLNTNLARLEKDKKITKEERELITRFKSLLDESSVADPMAGYTEEEIEEYKGMLEAEKREGIEEDFIETLSQPQSAFYSADDTGAFKLSEEERRYVKEANSITLKDIQELSLRDAKSVVRALEAMKAGFLTPELFQGVIKVRGVRGNMSIPLTEIKESGFIDKISSKISSSILNIGRKKKITGIGDRLRSAPTKNYEQILKVEKELLSDGSKRFKATNIYKSLFKPTSSAFSKADQTLTKIEDKLKNATALLSINQNERFIQKAKVMVFQIQREHDSNLGNKEVNQAKDWINATIKDKDTALDERDIIELEKIRDSYLTDGQVDAKKLYDSLTTKEKKFLETIDGVYDELTSMARIDAAVQGMPFIHRENYIHLPKSGTKTSEISNDFDSLFDSFMNASVKNKAAIQRTGKTHSISFDPVSNAYAAARKISVGYHMYPVIKSARVAFSGLKNRAETEFQKNLVNELESIYDKIINSQYKNVTKDKILIDNIINYSTKAGYYSQLGGLVKAASELGSNTLHAVMNHAGGIVDGYATIVGVDTKTIDKALENTQTTQMARLTKKAKFENKDIESKLMSKEKLFNAEEMTGELAASAKTVGKVAALPFKAVAKLNESLITKPDELVIRPLFVGVFQNKFRQLTGQKLNWEKLANDESYRDRFQEAINQASEEADTAVIDTAASINPFDTIPSNISEPDAGAIKKAMQIINRYMTNFRVFEYYSAVKGVQNLLGKGEISRGAGSMLLASTLTRMAVYRLGIDYAFGLIFSMLGMGDDEDEIKEEDITRNVLSGIVTLAFGRNLGNLSQTVINFGIEYANMKFGEGITWDSVTKDGEKTEYDPYKDSMVFSKISVKPIPGQDPLTNAAIGFTGPLAPVIKTTARGAVLANRSINNATKESRDKNRNELFFKTPFDMAGSMGAIPDYKDLKRINDRYWFGGNRDTEKKTNGKILGRTRTQSSRSSSTGRKAPRSNRIR